MIIVNKIGQTKCQVTLDNKILEQVSRYKYLGSWITDDARLCRRDKDNKPNFALAKEAS